MKAEDNRKGGPQWGPPPTRFELEDEQEKERAMRALRLRAEEIYGRWLLYQTKNGTVQEIMQNVRKLRDAIHAEESAKALDEAEGQGRR